MTGDLLTEEQHEVQRLLGRCLLRLQQFERACKMLYVHFSLSASLGEDVKELREKRRQQVAKLSLGQVATLLMEKFITSEDEKIVVDDAEPKSRQSPSIEFRHAISMPPEQRTRTLAEIDEFIEMRNQLVHHFIEKHDLWSIEGCQTAKSHLSECYDRITTQDDEIRDWLKNIAATMEMFRQFIDSDAGHDLLIKGILPKDRELTLIRNELPIKFNVIMPGGDTNWSSTRIVGELRQAANHLAESDGWTSLEAARFWLARHAPDEVPTKYGYQSWKQLIHESGQFELQNRRNKTGAGSRWFRARST